MIDYLIAALCVYVIFGVALWFTRKEGSGIIWAPACAYVGFTWNKEAREFFIFPLPCVGIVIKL